uniref:Uncharacterized protein n=1 Tax=Caenorhabditis japonica TaxID=281687 RepID=A0A8R1EID5_CAEJA
MGVEQTKRHECSECDRRNDSKLIDRYPVFPKSTIISMFKVSLTLADDLNRRKGDGEEEKPALEKSETGREQEKIRADKVQAACILPQFLHI